MHYFDTASISGPIFLHIVGNKQNGEPLVLTDTPLELSKELIPNLQQYFLSHFKQMEYNRFYHEASLSLNEIYTYVSAIFDDINSIEQQSKYIAQTLYRCNDHPNIKGGELYVVHFENCLIDGEMVDAVGLFKSENKMPFIKVVRNGNSFELIQERGINIEKLDKGCLIFNIQREEGYVVSVIDNTNKGEAKYWVDDFLRLRRKNDEYNQTQNVIKLCKGFIAQLPDETIKAEKASMMNKVIEGLNENMVDLSALAGEVFGLDKKEAFDNYRQSYQESNDIEIKDTFSPISGATNKRSIARMTTVKLDANFDIRIYGGIENLESGFDSKRKMNYYKLYYFNEH